MTPLRRLAFTCLAVAGLALVVLPTASGHVNVASVGPAGPMPVGQPSPITVTLSVNCAIVLVEYAIVPELDLALVPIGETPPPAYLPFVGETVPLGVDLCDPMGPLTVSTTGTVTVTPGPLAPAFQPIPVQPGAVGETNEGGNLTLFIQYAASLMGEDVSLGAGNTTGLQLVLTANADTVVLVETGAGHDHGGLTVPEEVEVASPLLAGNASRSFTLPLSAASAGKHTLTLTPVAKADRAIKGNPITVGVTVLGNTTAHAHGDEQHGEEASSKDSPAPVAALSALGLLALALLRRR